MLLSWSGTAHPCFGARLSLRRAPGLWVPSPTLVPRKLPPKVARIDATFDGTNSRAKIEGVTEVECGPIQYPDGSLISPSFTIPHGREFKTALAMNAKK